MSYSASIIYVATGEAYLKEAFVRAKITRCFSSGYPIFLYTDNISLAKNFNTPIVFDHIFLHESAIYGYRDKIVPLIDLPSDFCLFLDTDAFLMHDFQKILTLTSLFDISASYAPVRHPPGWSDDTCPSVFPELNSGVLFLRRSQLLTNLMKDWLHLYDELSFTRNQSWDQASLRSVIWSYLSHKHLSLHILPEEFNLRTTKPWIIGRGSPAYVIHGRFLMSEYDDFIEYISNDLDTFRTSSLWLASHPNSTIRPRFDRTYG